MADGPEGGGSGDKAPLNPEKKEVVQKTPEKKEAAPVKKEDVKAAEDGNAAVVKKYDDLKKKADEKKPEGYDPTKYPTVDKIPVPTLSWKKDFGPTSIFKTGGVQKGATVLLDALQTGSDRQPSPMDKAKSMYPSSTSPVDKPYRDVLGDRLGRSTTIIPAPPIKF